MEQGVVKNLERIQEHDEGSRTPRGAALALVAMGGACLVFAWLALGGRRAAAPPPPDPLGDLVAQQRAKVGPASSSAPPGSRPGDLRPADVTFPGILSDQGRPTTALAAVRGGVQPMDPSPVAPPPASDRLPVVPLPAQSVLDATPVVTRPRDALTRAASDSVQLAASSSGPPVAAGHDGAYQLQVSSFREKTESDQFADQLRVRGHRAYVVEAHVPGRGTWYRVRIGPFPTQQAAAAYRASFEQKEQVVPFLIPPASTAAARAATAAAPSRPPPSRSHREGADRDREASKDDR